jgi:predicted phosphohydrolase
MIDIVEKAPEQIIEVSFEGKISKEEYDKVNTLIESHKNKHGDINMLIEFHDFQWESASAMLEDLKISLKYFNDFNKLAVVGNKDWLETSADILDKIIPSIEMESFSASEKNKAYEWLQ